MGDAGSATALPAFTFTNTINGEARTSSNVAHHVNPLDKSKLWEVPVATKADLDEAVASAKEAFKIWSKVSWEERAKVLGEVKKVLEGNRAELTEILILEGGKPVDVAAGEVWASGFSLEWHSQQPNPAPEVLQDDDSLKLTMSWVPLGVTAAICPWNFPLILSVQKIAAALLTGNTMIVKPSPFTPYSILYLVSRIQHLFPHGGCVQALNGDDGLGPAITTHPGIEKISFTGSIATGKRVMAAAAGTLKRVTLELGGNSACIVLPDVDIAKVAPLVAIGAFYNSGQLCVASKRLYVHKDIYEEFRDAVVAVVKGWQVGGGGKMNLGPVQNGMQYEIVKKYFEDCAVNGYEFCLGGKVGDKGGYVIEPAILDNPPENSRIVKEEPFGPIVPMMPWSSEEELLERVNDTRTGLGGAIYGADIERAERIAGQIESGTVWINGPERPLAQAYFSGHKESGMGGEGGRKGLEAYMNAQVVHLYKGDVGKSSKL